MIEVYMTRLMGARYQRTLFVEPFWDLRQTMHSLGCVLDKGYRWCCVLQEPGVGQFAIQTTLLIWLANNTAQLNCRAIAVILWQDPVGVAVWPDLTPAEV